MEGGSAHELLWAFNPGEDARVMHKSPTGDCSGENPWGIRGSCGIAGLSLSALEVFDWLLQWLGDIGLPLPNRCSVANLAGKILARVMMYP
jgi:hypothetical protein